MDGETSGTVGRKIFNFQSVPRNDPATRQDNQLSEVGGLKEPVAPTNEAFPVTGNQDIFNITGFSINPYRSDVFVHTSDQTEEPSPMDIQDSTETVISLPVSEEEVFQITAEENHQGLGDLLHDPDTAMVQLTTDISVNLSSLMPTEEPELQRPVTPIIFQHLLHLQTSGSTSHPDLSFTNDTLSAGEAEARDIPDNFKMLQEKEMVSNILGDYLLPPGEVSESQSTSTISFDPAGYIPKISTPTPIIVTLASLSDSNKAESLKQANPSSDIVTKPVFHPLENTASTTLPPDTSAFRKTSVETSHSFHSPTDMPMAVRKFVDINPFPLNPGWPAKMGFHTYSAPEEPMTQSFENERFTIMHAKEKPHRRMMPEFQLDVLPSYSSRPMHSFNTDVHPVQFRYRQPVFHGHQRAQYPHPYDNNKSIHRPFRSAPRQSRTKFAFPGISSTRDNFRFRVDWIDEI